MNYAAEVETSEVEDDPLVSARQKLAQVADDLKKGKDVQPVRVREFLAWFGAHRRGFNIVERIRRALTEAELQSNPDFEEPHIDAEISFALIASSDTSGAESQPPRKYLSDPIWRVQRLKSASRTVISVAPTDQLQTAITKMLLHDYSQLPVLNGREVKGAITWESIGRKLVFGDGAKEVRNFMVDAHVVDGDTPLLEAIPEIITHQYVLVRGSDRSITGIVTTSDLSVEFREQAEPFLILREIEHQIRQFLIEVAKVPENSIEEYVSKQSGSVTLSRRAASIHDLNFGDYVRIMENEDWWAQLDIPIDRSEFINSLNQVREIRNGFMHFDPDTFERDASTGGENPDVDFLRRVNSFFQKILGVLTSPHAGKTTNGAEAR